MNLLTFFLSSFSHGDPSDIHNASTVTQYIHIFTLCVVRAAQPLGAAARAEALDLWVSEIQEQTPCPSPSFLLIDICIPRNTHSSTHRLPLPPGSWHAHQEASACSQTSCTNFVSYWTYVTQVNIM